MTVLQTPLYSDFRSSARAGDGTLTVSAGTTLYAGGLEILMSWADSGAHAITTNGGGAWTSLSGSPFSGPGTEKLYVWYRIITTGDTGGTVITASSSAVGTAAHQAALFVIAADSFDPTTPIDAVGTPNSGSSTTATLGSVTTVTNGAKLLALVGGGANQNVGTVTQTGQTYVERFDQGTTTGDDARLAMVDSVKSTAGATSAGSIALGSSMPWICVPIAIRPRTLAANTAHASWDAALAADVPRNWWKFDDASGTTAVDSGSTPTNGTYAGTPTLAAAKVLANGAGSAVSMDGADDEMSVAITLPATVTIEQWIDDWTADAVLVRDNSGTGGTIPFWITGGSFQARVNGIAIAPNPAVTSPQDGNRHYMALERNGADIDGVRLWLDGKLIASGSAGLSTSSPLHFGRNGTLSTAGDFATYRQDDAAIHTAALGGAKIVAHYEAGIATVSEQTISPDDASSTATANGPTVANATAQSLAPGGAPRTPVAGGVDLESVNFLEPDTASSPAVANGPSLTNVTAQSFSIGAAMRTAVAGGPALVALHFLAPGPAGGITAPPAEVEITTPVPFDEADYVEIPVDFSGIEGAVVGEHVEVQLWITTDDINQVEVDFTTSDYNHYARLFHNIPAPSGGVGLGQGPSETAIFRDDAATDVYEGAEPFVGTWLPDNFGFTFTDVMGGIDIDQGWFIVIDTDGASGTLEYAKVTLSEGGVLTSPAVANGPTIVGVPPEEAPEGTPEASSPPVPAGFTDAWTSRNMIGALRPHQVVEVRRGRYNRGYLVITNPDEIVDAIIPEEYQAAPWMAWWDPAEDWLELPGVLEVGITNNFEQNGLTTASFQVENVRLAEQMGEMAYHTIERGYLSPERGYDDPDRGLAGGIATEWQGRLSRMAQIRVWQGYGEPVRNEDGSMPTDGGPNGAWMFIGQLDDVDQDSFPDRMVLTARAGQPLTDERMFGWAKSKQLKDPVTFSDRLETDSTTRVGYSADASSNDGDAALVLDGNEKTKWVSAPHTTFGNTEWVQIRLPAGRYTNVVVNPAFGGMDMYIGVYGQAGSTVDGDSFSGWYGDDEVPGANGGWDYVRLIPTSSGRQMTRSLNHEFDLADDSIIRIGFRNLSYDPFDDDYKAGMTGLTAIHREVTEATWDRKWILVDDASDVVKVVLRWAGYRDWQVESTGVRMKGHKVYNRGTFLIDIIRDVIDATGYAFYMGRPPDGETTGMPVFRKNSSLVEPSVIVNVTEDDLLTDITTKEDTESLAYIIRVRGKETAEGVTLGGDSSNRLMAVYRPPWSLQPGEGGPDRLAGLLKHVTHTDPTLKTIDECEVNARLIALYEALASYQTTIVIPGHIGIDLDEQIGVIDSGTAVNSRLWITGYESSFTTGQKAGWRVTLTGAMLDTYDIKTIIDQLEEF